LKKIKTIKNHKKGLDCMSGWVRDSKSRHLNRVDINHESEPEIEDNKMGETRTLNDIFYLPRTIMPSCFNIPVLKNITLEPKPQYTYILPKFTGIEDTYLFFESLKRFVL